MSLPGKGTPESLIALTATTAAARLPLVSHDPLGCERRVLPVSSPPLGHDVCVRLEEQRLPRPSPLPHRPDVRAAWRGLLHVDLEARTLKVVRNKAGYSLLVASGLSRTIDARDADEFLHQVRQILAVDTAPHRLQELLEFGVGGRRGAALCQGLSEAALGSVSLQPVFHRAEEAKGHAAVEDA